MAKPVLRIIWVLTTILCAARAAAALPTSYQPIHPTAETQKHIVTLDGHSLTIDDVIAVARDGAKVRFSADALERGQANWNLLLEGDAEGLAIYSVNRGAGAEREVRSPRELRAVAARQRDLDGAREGALPEISEEQIVRAFLVIQANHLPYNAAPSAYMEAICDLLNKRVTPVMYARGTIGEGDLQITWNFHATLVGRGDAYLEGKRMSAAEALAKSGLRPYAGETGKATSNAYSTALAALLVADGGHALEWADLTLGLEMLGMNSSITPIAPIVQARRPFPWVNWEAAKLLWMLQGSYLTLDDPHRILQDSESLRAAHIRLGSVWEAWAELRDAVTLQINSGEQNPTVLIDAKPSDDALLSTPWMMRYHVKGGRLSGGRSGYILSNANWDPYPMTNRIEAFNLSMANFAATLAQRIERFSDRGPAAFFTGIRPRDVLSQTQLALSPETDEPFFTYLDVEKELQSLAQSLPAGSSGSDFGVADLEAMDRLKADRGRQAIGLLNQLLGYDLLTATYWLDVRKAQDPNRDFGGPATAVWKAFRQKLPFQQKRDTRPDEPFSVTAYDFITATTANSFLAGAPRMPETPPLPVAK